MKVSVLGLGNMGTAIAQLLAGNNNEVAGWDHFKEVVDEINKEQTNSRYLPDFALSEKITATEQMQEALKGSSILFFASPSRFLKDILEQVKAVKPSQDIILVSVSKGLIGTKTSSALIRELFPDNPLVVLSGPSIAGEFVRGRLTRVTLASSDQKALAAVAGALETETFKTEFSGDRTGVEWGGILKNCYALGLGLLNAAEGQNTNARGTAVALMLDEMVRLGEGLGGKRESLYGNSGLGDLITTTSSSQGHHFRFAKFLAAVKSLQKAEEKLGQKPEGLVSLAGVRSLAQDQKIPVPILDLIAEITAERMDPNDFTRQLFTVTTGIQWGSNF